MVRLALEKIEKIAGGMLVQGDTVFVLLVQLGNRVFVYVLRERDQRKRLQIVGVRRLEMLANLFEERLALFRVPISYQLDEGVDKYRPEKLRQLKLTHSIVQYEHGGQPWRDHRPCKSRDCSRPSPSIVGKLLRTSSDPEWLVAGLACHHCPDVLTLDGRLLPSC